jgi:predicted hydrocarbon binding protein
MSSLGRYAPNRLRRLINTLGSIRFKDETGEVEYFGQPVVMLSRDAIRLIRDELVRLGGAAGKVTVHTAGHVSGREEGKAILAKARAVGIQSPESLPSAILTAVEETNMGYGKIRIDNIDFGTLTFKISLSNSFEADQSANAQSPTCTFMLSYLKGLFSQLIGKDLGGEEVECKSKGDPCCRFRLSLSSQPNSKVSPSK